MTHVQHDHLTNNITSFCHCHCRSLRQMTGCGLTKLHILQGSSQGGPGVPVTPHPLPPFVAVNNILQTISVRLEQRNLCHLQLASCTIDLRRPWTRAFFFQPTSQTVDLRQSSHESGFTSTRFHDFETASKSMRFGSVYTKPFSPENQSRDVLSKCCTIF